MRTIEEIKKTIRGGLIVSCQALDNEPMHSSFIMGRFAKAAAEGGAVGIRANTAEDINEIKKNTSLPVIGIVKRDYEGSDVYITPTMKEVDDRRDKASASRKSGSLHFRKTNQRKISRRRIDGGYFGLRRNDLCRQARLRLRRNNYARLHRLYKRRKNSRF